MASIFNDSTFNGALSTDDTLLLGTCALGSAYGQVKSAMIEAGHLLLPAEAPWLAELRSELLGFPNARHDDQVDALSQLLAYVRKRESKQSGTPGIRWL